MKRKKSILIVLLLITSLVFGGWKADVRQAPASVATKKGVRAVTDAAGNYEYMLNGDGTIVITGYKGKESDVKIPSELEGNEVAGIGYGAFFNSFVVKSINLPASVTYIGDNAFANCKKLTKIDVDADNSCYASLNGILFNKDLTEVICAPEGMRIKKYRFPDSVTSIGDFAFFGNEYLEEITIPDHVIRIGEGAFKMCKRLKTAQAGRGTTDIGNQAFCGCSVLAKVTIAGHKVHIGEEAFYDCYKLGKINLSNEVITIGYQAFWNCGALKTITIPESVTKIGAKALGYSDEGNPKICIKGYYGTAAQRYAKKNKVVFQNKETGKKIRYDLIRIAKEKIRSLSAGKGQIQISYKEFEKAFYQIAVKKTGAKSWKKCNASKSAVIIRGLQSGAGYAVKVRACRKIDEKKYYGAWSNVKTITLK